MNCPICGNKATLVGCKYTEWQDVVFRCYGHGEYTFTSDSPEALRESEASLGQSRANAMAYSRESQGHV